MAAEMRGSDIEFRAEWTGLRGRRLASFKPRTSVTGMHVAEATHVTSDVTVNAAAIDAGIGGLAGLTRTICTPLYETSAIFQPDATFYERELTEMPRQKQIPTPGANLRRLARVQSS